VHQTHTAVYGSSFSLWEKVPEGRMRGLLPESPHTAKLKGQSPHPALKRATFSQREKEDP